MSLFALVHWRHRLCRCKQQATFESSGLGVRTSKVASPFSAPPARQGALLFLVDVPLAYLLVSGVLALPVERTERKGHVCFAQAAGKPYGPFYLELVAVAGYGGVAYI